jgi:hypothetical protein
VLLGVGEDRIVGLQAIFVEESLVTTAVSTSSLWHSFATKAQQQCGKYEERAIDIPNTLDIQQRVLEAQ